MITGESLTNQRHVFANTVLWYLHLCLGFAVLANHIPHGISTDGKAGAWRYQFTMFGNGSPRRAMIAIFAAVSRSVLTDLGLAEAM